MRSSGSEPGVVGYGGWAGDRGSGSGFLWVGDGAVNVWARVGIGVRVRVWARVRDRVWDRLRARIRFRIWVRVWVRVWIRSA